MNVPDFDKTSALIRSSAESANSMSVVGVSPVSIVMGGGPVDGIGTSISNCGIFTALDFRSLYLNNFFFDFFFQFWCRSAFQTPIFTKIVFNFCTHKWTRAGVCAWTSVWVYRRFVCYVLRATQNFHENLSHLYIAALFILPNTHTFNVRFFAYARSKWLNHITSPFNIYNDCLSWLYWFEKPNYTVPVLWIRLTLGTLGEIYSSHSSICINNCTGQKLNTNWTELNWIKRKRVLSPK